MNEYIDVRGVWPVYINGIFGYTLDGYWRVITVLEVRAKEELRRIIMNDYKLAKKDKKSKSKE